MPSSGCTIGKYSNNVIYQLEKWTNTSHTLGSTYSSSENSELTDEKSASTARTGNTSAEHRDTAVGGILTKA